MNSEIELLRGVAREAQNLLNSWDNEMQAIDFDYVVPPSKLLPLRHALQDLEDSYWGGELP